MWLIDHGERVIELSNISTSPKIVWSYIDNENFFATNISGAVSLDNGNTLIGNGPIGQVFEVTPEQDIVWEYSNPYYSIIPQKSIEGFSGNSLYLFC